MNRTIDITVEQRKTLQALIEKHLPNTAVWVYGSRVQWTARPQSDLDMVVFASPSQNGQVSALREAFEENNLPFRVDLFVWDDVPDQFRKQIEAEYAVLVKKEDRGLDGMWHTTTLGDCIVINNSTYSPKEEWLFVNYLDTGNITENRMFEIQHLVVGKDKIPSRARRKAQPGDIVYSTVRPNQKHFGLLKKVPENFLASTGFSVIRGKDGFACTDFIYWFLTQDYIVEQLQTIAEQSTSAYPSIRSTDIECLSLYLPPISEQRAIAHILGTLDDKIELNRRMNESLEAMARALFKSWFVDFDPVHAKATLKRHDAHLSLRQEDFAKSQSNAPSHTRITPPLRGSRQDKGASPPSSRWGVIKRQYSQQTLQNAKALRQNQTNAEGLLWHYLRNKQLDGHKFRRQQPIGPYIVDFACMPRKLIVELDGGQHAKQKTYDEKRDTFLKDKGYRILRFWNNEVFENCFVILESIYAALHHHPPLEGGSKDASLSGRGSPPPHQPSPAGSVSATPPRGGSEWTPERARAYLDSMDDDIMALFPDSFEDSKLGKIPKGWGIVPLSEIIEINPTRSLQKGEIAPYLDMANMPTRGHAPDMVIDRPFGSGMRFANGDTLIARITPCLENGKTAYVDFLSDDQIGWGSTEYIVMRPKRLLPGEFVYCLARSTSFRKFAIQNMTGTSGRQRVPAIVLSQFLFTSPPNRITAIFGKVAQLLFARSSEAIHESRTLAAVRDTLLPKLVSGEIRIHEIEKLKEATI